MDHTITPHFKRGPMHVPYWVLVMDALASCIRHVLHGEDFMRAMHQDAMDLSQRNLAFRESAGRA